jgi:hypothetical protein
MILKASGLKSIVKQTKNQLKIIPWHYLGDAEENHEEFVRIDGVSIDISYWVFSECNLERSCFPSLLCSVIE